MMFIKIYYKLFELLYITGLDITTICSILPVIFI